MTVYYPSSVTGSGTVFTFAANGDDLVVLPGVTLASTNDAAIGFNTFSGNSIEILGTVASAFILATPAIGDGTLIHIGEGGRFLGFDPLSGNGGLYLENTDSLVNDGEITALTSNAVLVSGAASIVNTGHIAGATGVFMGLSEAGGTLVNSGTITANAYFDAYQGSRFNSAVQIDGNAAHVTNLAGGVLAAISSEGDGVHAGNGAGGTVVENHGTISSLLSFGIDFAEQSFGNDMEVINSGLITGGAGAIDGGAGVETVVNTGTLAGDVFLNDGDDVYTGRGDLQVLGTVFGGAGSDRLVGGHDGDTLDGGADDDTLIGHDGDDVLSGGTGRDDIFGGAGSDELYGGNDKDLMRGGDGGDEIHGGGGNDTLRGDDGADSLYGGNGGDSISGDAGDDELFGDAGSDTIHGGSGNDAITGGADRDTLYGGAGADVFIYTSIGDSTVTGGGSDFIEDFQVDQDVIDLTALHGAGNNQFVGTDPLVGGGDASVSYSVSGSGRAVVLFDVDGDGVADMRFNLEDTAVLTAHNFLL